VTIPIGNDVYKVELAGTQDTDIFQSALVFCRVNGAALGLTADSDLGSLCVEPVAMHIVSVVHPAPVAAPVSEEVPTTETVPQVEEPVVTEPEVVAEATSTPEPVVETEVSKNKFAPLVLMLEGASEADNINVSIVIIYICMGIYIFMFLYIYIYVNLLYFFIFRLM